MRTAFVFVALTLFGVGVSRAQVTAGLFKRADGVDEMRIRNHTQKRLVAYAVYSQRTPQVLGAENGHVRRTFGGKR